MDDRKERRRREAETEDRGFGTDRKINILEVFLE
jgi:hypothetical protein